MSVRSAMQLNLDRFDKHRKTLAETWGFWAPLWWIGFERILSAVEIFVNIDNTLSNYAVDMRTSQSERITRWRRKNPDIYLVLAVIRVSGRVVNKQKNQTNKNNKDHLDKLDIISRWSSEIQDTITLIITEQWQRNLPIKRTYYLTKIDR